MTSMTVITVMTRIILFTDVPGIIVFTVLTVMTKISNLIFPAVHL